MLAAKVNIAISREVGIAGSPRSATRIHAVAGTRLPSLRALFILEHCFILIFSSWLCSRTALALFAQNRQPGCTKSSRKPGIAPIDSDGKLSRSDVLHRDLPEHAAISISLLDASLGIACPEVAATGVELNCRIADFRRERAY